MGTCPSSTGWASIARNRRRCTIVPALWLKRKRHSSYGLTDACVVQNKDIPKKENLISGCEERISIAIFLSKLFTVNKHSFRKSRRDAVRRPLPICWETEENKSGENADLKIWRIYSLSLIYVGGFQVC